MRTKINDGRTQLTITANRAERRHLKTLGDEIHCDAVMHDQLEHWTANSELEWIDPAQTGDLTSAPMVGILDKADQVAERWAFMDYQVRSVLEDLRDRGAAVFVGGAVV